MLFQRGAGFREYIPLYKKKYFFLLSIEYEIFYFFQYSKSKGISIIIILLFIIIYYQYYINKIIIKYIKYNKKKWV